MEIFHVLNRGVDKRVIFEDDSDRFRFMQGLYMYNDASIVNRNQRRNPANRRLGIKRDLLVHIHAFCLMNNHYHLLLSPTDDKPENLSAFMRKLNMGYAKYFNEKYDRSGALWQGKYKKVYIERDAHFMYIPYYIHLNPLDYTFPEWRTGELQKQKEALAFLQTYRWSSYLDYIGVKNHPSILFTDLLSDILGSKKNQTNNIRMLTNDPVLAMQSEIIER